MDLTFVCTKPVSPVLFPGRHILVSGVSKAAPTPAWVLDIAQPFNGPAVDPWPVDAEAFAREQAAAAAVPEEKQKHYNREEMKRIFGVDDTGLNQLFGQYGLQKPRLVHEVKDNLAHVVGSHERWDARIVDPYREGARRLFAGLR